MGIVVAKSGGTTSDGTTIEGLGFAIPIDDVKEVVQELSTNGYVTGRPSLGVNLVDITNEQTAMMYRVNQLGVYVLKSTNEANNLQAGDCIVSVDGNRRQLCRRGKIHHSRPQGGGYLIHCHYSGRQDHDCGGCLAGK